MIFKHRQNQSNEFPNIEIDIRSSAKGLVLSHDRGNYDECTLLKDVASEFKSKTIICNVKESGLEEELLEILGDNIYFLDSQLPDIVRLSKTRPELSSKFIIRVSNVEPISKELLALVKPEYIWVDWTKFDDFNEILYASFINKVYNIAKPIIVSPELYGDKFEPITEQVQEIMKMFNKGYSVCTKLSTWEYD